MAEKPARGEPRTMAEVKELLQRREENLGQIATAYASRDAIMAVVTAETAKVTNPLVADNRAIEEAVEQYLVSRRRNILRRYGKTFAIGGTEIKWRVIPKSLEVPADDTAAINYLLHRPDGEGLLRATWSLDKDALKSAPPAVLKALRRFGIVVAKHEHLTIKSSRDDKPRLLWRQRFPRGRTQ